jgi:photosystem II stability/assembly factor-like uncharacterized protein
VKKYKTLISLLGLLLVMTACNAPVATPTVDQPAELPPTQEAGPDVVTELPPTPFPDTPAPAAIDAPLVDTPSLVSIRFLNELDGWGVTETQIVRTNNGGITWYNVTPPDLAQAGYSVNTFILDNAHVWIQMPDMANYPNAGTLYRTSDAGLTWIFVTTPFSGAGITFLDNNNGWALADLGAGAGSQGVAIFQTTDGGASWNRTYTNDPNQPNAKDSLPLGGIKSGLTPLNMQTAWVSGVTYSDGTVYLYRTDDGGANWSQVTTLALPPVAQNTQVGFEPVKIVSATDAFVTVRIPSDQSQLAVFISNDAGNTWSFTPTLIPNGGSADFLSATEAVIYNGEQFYVTRDAARTWSIIPPDVVFGDSFAMMDFVNVSSGWVVTVDPTTNQRSLYRTSDGGLTWSPVIP